jgi:formylglycine-generating enzyme required for sulfatase activity
MQYQRIASVLIAMSLWLLTGVGMAAERGMGVAGSTPQAPAGEYWLLSIGVDEYLHWPKLKTAVNDADAVQKTLTAEFGFTPNRVVSLRNAQATRAAIVQAMRKLAQELRPDDSLLIFYAGHGQLDDLTGAGSWVPVDASRDDASTWIENSSIKTLLRAMKARHVLLVSDSCFAGDFFRGHRGALPQITDEYVRKAFGMVSRQAITSGGVEPVSDDGAEGHSVFTYFLLKGLKEATSPYLLPSDLWQRIKGGVAANARQNPQLGILQDTNAEIGGEFVLFRKGVSGVLDAALAKKKEQMTALEKMEQAAREAQSKELALQQQKESELKALDARIAEMQKKLGGKAPSDATLDQLLAMVDQKEKQAAELESLRQKAEQEKRNREAEIERLRQQELTNRKTAFEADYAKYERIRDSKAASDEMKLQAWQVICRQWNVASAGDCPAALFWTGNGVNVGMPISLAPESGRGCRLFLTAEVTMDMVWIPKGEGVSGGFWIGRCEVTQKQFESVMKKNPSLLKGDDLPVHNVNWNEAKSFVDRLNSLGELRTSIFRLPTGDEWEVACRGGSKRRFSTGDTESDLAAVAWYLENSSGNIHPVGRKQPNAYGVHDMLGNVLEWCIDKTIRGGAYCDWPSSCTVDSYEVGPTSTSTNGFGFIGFRVLREAK